MSGGFKAARHALGDLLDSALSEAGWSISYVTDATDVYHQTIVIGHASTIKPMSMRSSVGSFTVTFWVSEADDNDAEALLYSLFDPGDGSIFKLLATTNANGPSTGTPTFLSVQVGNMGTRQEGPSGFLAADVEVDIQVRYGE